MEDISGIYTISIVVYAVIFAVVCEEMGSRKGMSGLGCFYGFFFGILGIIFTLLSKGNRRKLE